MMRENETIHRALLTIDLCKGRVSNFRTSIVEDDFYKSANFSRLLIWKVCLITDTLDISKWDEALKATRVVYGGLTKRTDLRVPWHRLDPDSVFYKRPVLVLPVLSTSSGPGGSGSGSSSGISSSKSLKTVIARQTVESSRDPLAGSSNTDNTANNGTADPDLDILTQITLDVERIFPGNEFFHASTAIARQHRATLVEILYIWSKCNPSIGYKQGLHEIVGLLYLNFCKESIELSSYHVSKFSVDDLRILKLYSAKYLAHDTFTVFNKFLNQSGLAMQFYGPESRLFESIQTFNVHLLKVDQLIHYNLTSKLRLESQLWIIRYFRLLMSREFGNDLNVVMRLWEKLVAYTSAFGAAKTGTADIISFMIVALLIHIKTDLIALDFSEALSLLLHYPIAKVKQKYTGKVEFYQGLFKDAVQLYERRDKDLKLYEYGIKLNEMYNPNLRFQMSYAGRTPTPSPRPSVERSASAAGTPPPVPPKTSQQEQREEKMKFEKLRLEMRLKKKAQEMVGK